jgi:hypothetical protein
MEADPLDLKIIHFLPTVIVKNLAGQVPSSDSARPDKNISYTRIIFSPASLAFSEANFS